jgi:hypothetical protein
MIQQGRGGRIIGASSIAGKMGASYSSARLLFVQSTYHIQAFSASPHIQPASSLFEDSLKSQVIVEIFPWCAC